MTLAPLGDVADLLQHARGVLFEQSPFGIAVMDAAGTIVDGNDALVRLLRRDRSMLVGRNFAEAVAGEDRGELAEQFGKLVMGTVRGVTLEAVGLAPPAPGGHAISVHAAAIGVEGAVAGILLHVADATEHRIQQARSAHAERLYTLGQLAGSIAHDFNNLIAAMLGFCDLLLSRRRANEPDHNDLLQIHATALRARDLVRQLLAFARKQPLHPVRLGVGRAISDLRPMLCGLLGRNIVLETTCTGPLPRIRMDHARFDQVIVNLVINARDAMPDGGELAVRCFPLVIDAAVVRGGDTMHPGTYVAIEVTDTGCGIRQDIIDQIFEPFFTTKQMNGGTGLGLATVWGIVRQSGGHVEVESAVGQGTTFRLYLPAASEPAETSGQHVLSTSPARSAAVGKRQAAAVQGRGRRVLLVEDDAAVRTFASRALRGRGFTMLEAEDGDVALQVIATEPQIDVLLADLRLPGADGRQVIEQALQRFPQARVIVISADPDPDLIEAGGQHTRLSTLAKPFTLAELALAVQRALGE